MDLPTVTKMCIFGFKELILVELGGLEPPTFSLQMRRSSQVNYSPSTYSIF